MTAEFGSDPGAYLPVIASELIYDYRIQYYREK